VALHTIDALIAEGAAVGIETVVAVLGLPDNVAVHAVFVSDVSEDQVAITAAIGHVAVVAILAVHVHETNARDDVVEDCHLSEERAREVRIDAVLQPVPAVAPPFLNAINRKRRVLIVHGDDLFPREIARAMVEMEEIAEHQPSLPPAIWTLHRVQHIERAIELLFLWGQGK